MRHRPSRPPPTAHISLLPLPPVLLLLRVASHRVPRFKGTGGVRHDRTPASFAAPSRKRWRDNKEHRTPPLRPVCLIVLWPRKFAQVSFFFFKLRTSLSPISLGYTRQRESEKAQERMSETEKGISAFESSGYYRFSPRKIRFSFFTNRISRSPISLGYTRLRRKLESDNN